uniref:Uncharacterized protein n=1 Tax=Arundo donax TaxID=35708 RepID=A0A0A8ZGX9_ARUDO
MQARRSRRRGRRGGVPGSGRLGDGGSGKPNPWIPPFSLLRGGRRCSLMDAPELAALLSMLQDNVQEAAQALKKVAVDNLTTDSCPAAMDMNWALLEVESIAQDLEQVVFQVEDALIRAREGDHSGTEDNLSVPGVDETSVAPGSGEDDVLSDEWSSETVLCPESVEEYSIESDRSWRL